MRWVEAEGWVVFSFALERSESERLFASFCSEGQVNFCHCFVNPKCVCCVLLAFFSGCFFSGFALFCNWVFKFERRLLPPIMPKELNSENSEKSGEGAGEALGGPTGITREDSHSGGWDEIGNGGNQRWPFF